MSDPNARPPRDDLFRMRTGGFQLREKTRDDGAATPVLEGFFNRFNEWTEIDSMWEGRFMERFAPGAFKKTFKEQREGMRVLFQHGRDPQVGDKPLGPIDVLEERAEGPWYEVPLLDADYVRNTILPGLKANLYGASFRFRTMREEVVDAPEPSDSNPLGLPERTIKEAQVREFGPVTFPAYANATAGIRSITDDIIIARMAEDPDRLRAMFKQAVDLERMDSEDVGILAGMLECASSYIEEQDEEDTTEQANIVAMQAIQAELIKLLNVEAVEDEPDEPEDEGRNAPAEGEERQKTTTKSKVAPLVTGAGRKSPLPLHGAARTLNGKEPWRL